MIYQYDPHKVREVKEAKDLGFSMYEISQLVDVRQSTTYRMLDSASFYEYVGSELMSDPYSIYHLELPEILIYNIKKHQIRSMKDLAKLSPDDVSNWEQFGPKKVDKIVDAVVKWAQDNNHIRLMSRWIDYKNQKEESERNKKVMTVTFLDGYTEEFRFVSVDSTSHPTCLIILMPDYSRVVIPFDNMKYYKTKFKESI